MTPEAKVKAKVKKILTDIGCYWFMPATGGYGSSGVPDFIACIDGLFFGIECKAGRGVTTALQDKHLNAIKANRGFSMVVNELSVDSLHKTLLDIRASNVIKE